MKKRLLSTILMLFLMVSMRPGMTFAADVNSGKCGDNLTWRLNNTTLIISGSGAMWDWTPNTVPWAEKCGTIMEIEIEDGVTSIGDGAFSACIGLGHISIPDSMTSIGQQAFFGCLNLSRINLPDSITSIGDLAFQFCYNLIDITIPASVNSIGDSVFTGCTRLSAIEVDSGNSSYMSLSGVLFTKSGSNLIQYPAGKSDSRYVIPDGVTSIGNCAFQHCSHNLSDIFIPDSVTSIGDSAFQYCSQLRQVRIPASVNTIGNGPFAGCSKLSAIEIDPDNNRYMSLSGVLFTKDGKSLIQYPENKYNNDYVIPDGVTSIGQDAFLNCANLKSITIPNSVTSIGEGAFYECTGLKDIHYFGSEEQWDRITFAGSNDPLQNATIHYDSTGPEEPPASTPGDLNGDGKVTMADVMRLARGAAGYVILTDQEQKAGDVTGDGKITMADVIRVARYAAGYSPSL